MTNLWMVIEAMQTSLEAYGFDPQTVDQVVTNQVCSLLDDPPKTPLRSMVSAVLPPAQA